MYANPILLPQMTNRESWKLILAVNDDDTGDPVALMAADGSALVSIQFEVRYAGPPYQGTSWNGIGSSAYYWYDDNYCQGPILSASIGAGITLLDTGFFQVFFAETDMRTLCRGTYNVGCTMTDISAGAFSDAFSDAFDIGPDVSETRQIFRGRLPILDGYVTS